MESTTGVDRRATMGWYTREGEERESASMKAPSTKAPTHNKRAGHKKAPRTSQGQPLCEAPLAGPPV